MHRSILPVSALLVLLAGAAAAADYAPSQLQPPAIQREFRGAWIATVYNIDWPSKPGAPASTQQTELRRILDRAAALKLNAVMLQVRPSSDALYNSNAEPWSSWLTGKMGKPPAPYYDPLEFAVTEAHARGLELHAWFNPFRALPNRNDFASERHVSKRHPGWIIRYGNYLWLDPAEDAVHDHVIGVILDVVRRYAVDGVHLDDYFYPYPAKGKSGAALDFPDERAWARYQKTGGKLGRADWRRDNVSRFVHRLYREVKAVRPAAKVGISPFGIWRPRVPATIEAGLDAYDQLYADARLWLRNGWLDYLSPQLYWSIKPAKQSFPVLLKWWAAENTSRRHVWPGIATERIGPARPAQEMVNQIRLTREVPLADGHIHWSMKSLMQNKGGVNDLLAQSVYDEPALVPACPWLGPEPPGPVELEARPAANGITFQWKASARGAVPARWAVQYRAGEKWSTRILPGSEVSLTFRENLPRAFAVVPVSATGITGKPAVLEAAAR